MQFACKLKYTSQEKKLFVFIIHKGNKHGVSTSKFTEADIQDIKSGALRTTANINRSMVNWKKILSQVHFKDFVYRYSTAF